MENNIDLQPIPESSRAADANIPPEFDVLSIAVILLQYGFRQDEIEAIDHVSSIKENFLDSFDKSAAIQNLNIISKSITARNLLGKPTFPSKLVQCFEERYQHIIGAANVESQLVVTCNVLNAIIGADNPAQYISQVGNVSTRLCDIWFSADGLSRDHLGTSEFHIMILSECLIQVLKLWDKGILLLPDELMKIKLPLMLFQLLMQTLQRQNADGSWGVRLPRELSAYAILALTNLCSLPFLGDLKPRVQQAITRGREFIILSGKNELIMESRLRMTSLPANITEAYLLAALQTKYPTHVLSSSTGVINISEKGLKQYSFFFSKLKCTRNIEPWRIYGSVLEGYLFLPKLHSQRIDMFDRAEMKDDKYLDFIAMTLTCANNLKPYRVSADVLFDMMILTLRAYQIDEFVEHVVAKNFGDKLDEVENLIRDLFENENENDGAPVAELNGKSTSGSNTIHVNSKQDFLEIRDKLKAFADRILQHPSVTTAHAYDQKLLKSELQSYLLAHIAQIHDSTAYYARYRIPQNSYNTWVRSTGAAHVFVTFSLAYLQCLIKLDPCTTISAEERYIAQDIWLHLAKKVRMENDRPCLARDRKEQNLNSLDFPEFRTAGKEHVAASKEQITLVILYEKRRYRMALRELERVVGRSSRAVIMLRWYAFLTDVVGDVYALRDISVEA